MQLSREQGIGGQAFLEFFWKSLERMIWREENVDLMGVDELLGSLQTYEITLCGPIFFICVPT